MNVNIWNSIYWKRERKKKHVKLIIIVIKHATNNMAFFLRLLLLAYIKIIRFHEVNVFPAFQVYETL